MKEKFSKRKGEGKGGNRGVLFVESAIVNIEKLTIPSGTIGLEAV